MKNVGEDLRGVGGTGRRGGGGGMGAICNTINKNYILKKEKPSLQNMFNL